MEVKCHPPEGTTESPWVSPFGVRGQATGRHTSRAQANQADEGRRRPVEAAAIQRQGTDDAHRPSPKHLPDDPEKQARIIALIHCQVETGLAIRDTVQLERDHIKGRWLRIRTPEDRETCPPTVAPGLYDELLTVTDGNPKYVFWNGTSLPESATGRWQTDLRELMKDAGVWIRGNLSHRFRDTAVDFWLSEGRSVEQVAAYLGDTVRIVERHYADLISERMEKQLASVPFRSWGTQSDWNDKTQAQSVKRGQR